MQKVYKMVYKMYIAMFLMLVGANATQAPDAHNTQIAIQHATEVAELNLAQDALRTELNIAEEIAADALRLESDLLTCETATATTAVQHAAELGAKVQDLKVCESTLEQIKGKIQRVGV